MYYRARFYDTELGRFLQKDPLTGGPDDPSICYKTNIYSFFDRVITENINSLDPHNTNRYAYCRNNPINFTDPLGLWAWDNDWVQKGVGGMLGFYGAGPAKAALAASDRAVSRGVNKFGEGVKQMALNAVDTAGMVADSAANLAGANLNYKSLGNVGKQAEANKSGLDAAIQTTEIVKGTAEYSGSLGLAPIIDSAFEAYRTGDMDKFSDTAISVGMTNITAAVTLKAYELKKPYYRYVGEKSSSTFDSKGMVKDKTWLTRDKYSSMSEAKSKLQMPNKPTNVQTVRVPFEKHVGGPRKVSGNLQWGKGRGTEYRVGVRLPKKRKY